MSQNARVALWVPTATPPHANGDAVFTTGLPDAIAKIPTQFTQPSGGGSGGGIPEAPSDGQLYSRRGSDATWQVSPSGGGSTGGVEEAPLTGGPFVRQAAAWVSFDIIDAGTF